MRIWISSALIISIIVNAIPTSAQNSVGSFETAGIVLSSDRFEANRALLSDPALDKWLTAITSDKSTARTIEARRDDLLIFFQNAIKDDFQTVVEKAREFNKNRYEQQGVLNGKTTPQSPFVLQPQSLLPTDVSFINASYLAQPADSPEIIVTETETSRGSKATDVKTIENETSIVTQTVGVDSNVSFEGNSMSQESNTSTKVEAASKTDRSKLTNETKQGGAVSFGVCPDAAGIVRGKARYRQFKQTTINTGTQLAALTIEYVIEYQITAHVNDSAEMTDFDMAGTITEKTFGYDRAYRLGLAENKTGVVDGTRSINYSLTGNTPPTGSGDAQIGNATQRSSGISTIEESKRISQVHNLALSLLMLDLKPIMLSSVSRWRNYECVDVKCVSPKKALKPNESTEVDAVSVSKLDSTQFNANLSGSGTQSVTPGNGPGKPNIVFTLTAPKKGTARIVVESISRRGIGLEVLEIPVEEPQKLKPPAKTPKPKDCDAGWTGTVKAVNTRREDREEAPSGRLVRSVSVKSQTFSVEIDLPGTRDLTGGIVNNFIGAARAGYLASDYRERTYASGRMSCSTGIIESGQVQKYESQTKGDATARILVAISVIGRRGYLSFSPPQILAEVIHIRTYESNCPSYNAANSSTERDAVPRDIPGPDFEVEFDADPRTPNQIKGTKTIQNSDGSETTYSWDLTRCK
ncbi:MAG: hypothetical protein IPN69_00945 [Acidobacteria bacterium]|nr:hypothetical protein [Acidobacteriota bacterium]